MLAATALVGCAQAPLPAGPYHPQVRRKTGPPAVISEHIDVSSYALLNGVSATPAQCAAIASAVWVTVDGDGDCIRYFTAGFADPGRVDRAVIYFAGDSWDGQRASPGYERNTLQRLVQWVDRQAARVGMPYVFVARPGTLGSSGDHMQRRRKRESLLISAALDAIKARLRIGELVVAGYSGGGHVVSSLLTMRNDIVCAVPIAAVASPRLRARLRNWAVDSTGHDDAYEPTDHLDKAAMHPGLRVVVVGDPLDNNAVWPAQVVLADELSAIGVPNAVVTVVGSGPGRHFGQGDVGHRVAAWCARGLSFADIAARAAASTP